MPGSILLSLAAAALCLICAIDTRHTVSDLPCCRGVCYYVSTNGLLGVSLKHGGPIYLGNNLIGDHHCHTKLQEKLSRALNYVNVAVSSLANLIR